MLLEQTKIIRILIVDDHTVVRQGIAQILRAEPDFEVVGEAANGLDALELARKLQPDLILMDLQMPEMNGVEAIKQLTAENPRQKIIILTTYSTDDYIFEGIRAGAKGYLLKDVPKQELYHNIRLIEQGMSLVQPDLVSRLFSLVAQGGQKKEEFPPLTERELEVLKFLARGERNKEIALHLSISESTVKSYLASIYQKFNVTDRTQAAMYALEKGLIKPDQVSDSN